MSRLKVGDRVARNGKTYKITRVSPGGLQVVVVSGRGEGKTQRTFSVDDVTKARVA